MIIFFAGLIRLVAKIDALAPFAIDFYEDASPSCLHADSRTASPEYVCAFCQLAYVWLTVHECTVWFVGLLDSMRDDLCEFNGCTIKNYIIFIFRCENYFSAAAAAALKTVRIQTCYYIFNQLAI